jgi:hypothetical protein
MKALAILAAILCIAGYIPYICGILTKQTKPAKVSWIAWSVLDITGVLAMYSAGAVNGYIIGASAGTTIIALLSLKYGIPGWTLTDKFCLAATVISITLWQTFNNPVLGIIIGCIAGFAGSIPTLLSAWEDPSRENKPAWAIWYVACILGLIIIPKLTLADSLMPITFFIVQTGVVFTIFIRPFFTIRRLVKKMCG